MRILSNYIGRTILFTILLTVFLIVSIDMLFLLVNELRAVGEGNYTIFTAFQYILLVLPERLYFLFPMACLVGALVGLGLLAGHSELIVMRSSGVSLLQITGAVLKAAFILVVVITLFGELVVPRAVRYAEVLREQATSGSQSVVTPQGTWMRDGNHFVRIKQILPNGDMKGIIRYTFDDKHDLESATYAERAEFNSDNSKWTLYNVKETDFAEKELTVFTADEKPWDTTIQPRLINILIEEPESLSILGLLNYIQYLRDNQLRTQEYSLTLWKKLWQPFATMVMVFIAIPVIFGPLRSATMGLRLLTGVMLGFAFYILNQLFGPLSLVYGAFPPFLAAILPSIVFGIGGLILYRRIH